MKKGRAGPMTHDYKRNGVTTLFAALVAAKAKSVTQMQAGEVIGACMPRHRAKEFLRFLKKMMRQWPGISMCTWFSTTTGPTPFKWSAKADAIIEKTVRARQVFEQSNSGTK
jgi:hypothetical protein